MVFRVVVDQPLRLVIHLGQPPKEPDDEQVLRSAVQKHFANADETAALGKGTQITFLPITGLIGSRDATVEGCPLSHLNPLGWRCFKPRQYQPRIMYLIVSSLKRTEYGPASAPLRRADGALLVLGH